MASMTSLSPNGNSFAGRLAPRRLKSLNREAFIVGIALFSQTLAPSSDLVLRRCEAAIAQPAGLKAIAPAAVAMTTMSGGARQTIKATKPAAAMAKSAGPLTALVHTGL